MLTTHSNGSRAYGDAHLAATTSFRTQVPPTSTESTPAPISSYFGEATFSLAHMRDRLPKDAYQEILRSLDQSKKISKETSDIIAQVIKEWAVAKGATHFCHWFQPMTGLTAEKHDAFISVQQANHSELSVIERFSGSQLVQGEPDASSFPSGGMRSTFEARGYTAWDPTSPLFIIDGPRAKTLCIPSVFFGYHGQALDHKTPLLRSIQTLSHEACRFLKKLGDVDVKAVTPTLGAEQEYFLIDKETAGKRPDLVMTGRTLLGAASCRGQKLEDHYFGSIPTRAKAFMEDLEYELYRLGIPVKTRHNEVAPSQFEMAPIFENAAISADHNTLAMETMKRIASQHGFFCLLHEKPFAEINGNGKHCNWSLSNDKGENLLEPGHTPHQNLRFLAMVAVVIKAVNDHADLLGASIMSPGNTLRLGGNEAPPAIISIFLGSMLESIFTSIENDEAAQASEKEMINLGVGHIPNVSKDYTDRNRTSPFAFTGNKFEFRAVGSSTNVAVPVSILNAAVADALSAASKRLSDIRTEEKDRNKAVMTLIRELIAENKRVLFSGNNYSEEWFAEAVKRGLPVIDSCQKAFSIFKDEKATAFLRSTDVLTADEILSRHNINLERYITSTTIEMDTLNEMINEFVIPALEQQLVRSYEVVAPMEDSDLRARYLKRVKSAEGLLNDILAAKEDLSVALDALAETEDEDAQMAIVTGTAAEAAKRLRASADVAEQLVADEFWALPKYRELLFHPSMR